MRCSTVLLFVCLFSAATFVRGTVEDDDIEDLDLGEEAYVQDEQPAEEAPPKPKEKIEYISPKPSGNAFFFESFDDKRSFTDNWVISRAKKDGADAEIAKYDGTWLVEEASEGILKGDLGLVLASKAKHHAVSSKLKKPYEFTSETIVIQYDVRFTNGQDCGGAYIKLLSHSPKLSLSQLTDKTPYTIMFGPDKCGNDNKLHFIFRHKNPVSGVYEEKHAKKPSGSIDNMFTDKRSHLLTLVINSDNTFQIYLDQKVVNSGSLLADFEPAVNPAKEVVDQKDKKPAEWDDREKVADPDAKKPEDWDETAPKQIPDEFAVKPEGWLDDEPELVADPEAEKPKDWDNEMDGEWEPPQITNPKCQEAPGCGEWKVPVIDNPNYKGKWKAPMIDNPEFKNSFFDNQLFTWFQGKWSPRMIANPDYFEDSEPWRLTSIGAVGLELWSMSDGIIFDNFIITDDKKVADDLAKMTWELKNKREGSTSGKSVVDYLLEAAADKPWLWVVYVAVIVLPCVGLFQLIRPRKYIPLKTNDASMVKKTDAVTADDAQPKKDQEEEEDAEADDEAGGDKDSTEKKSGKGALESKDEGEAEETESRTRKRKPRKD